MKNLIKLLILVFAFSAATETFAQTFGVKAGLNLSNMLVKNDDHTFSDDYKMKPGFHVGVTAEFPFSDMVSFETGLLLSTKGFKESEGDAKFNANLLYIDIPLTARTTFDVGGAKIYGTFGPYLSMGLSGKYKFEDGSESEEEDVKWGSGDEDDLKRLDFGLTIGAGLALNAIEVGLSYNLGLANVASTSDGGFKSNHRVIGVSVAYKLGK
ncbi:MAG: porin family protein [Bacteroidales bacterium]|nr:porin family protein [Bacteroidales bacterium]